MTDAMTADNQHSAISPPPQVIGDAENAAAFERMSQHGGESVSDEKKPLSVTQATEHAGLGAAELIPGYGHIAAAADAASYAEQGYSGKAALSVAEAVIPGADELGGMAQVVKAGAHLAMGGFGIGHAELHKLRGGDV